MLKVEDRKLYNSLGPNVYNDDKTADNYKALAYCIAGIEIDNKILYASVDQACRAFNLFNVNSNKIYTTKGDSIMRCNKNLKYIVENIKTGEKIECFGSESVVKLTGIKYSYLATYIKKQNIYKKTYKFYRAYEASYSNNGRMTKITDIKTKEEKIFENLQEASEFINLNRSTVIHHMKRNQPARGWIVEFID